MEGPLDILLVEDNPGDARLIQELLNESDLQLGDLVNTERLDSALGQLENFKPHVVLLDLSLPDSQGVETIRRIRESARGLPIVVLTGLTDQSLALMGVQEGVQDYLMKGDLSPGLLSRAIHYAVDRNRAEQALRERKSEVDRLADNLAAKNRLFKIIGSLQSQFIREPDPFIMFDILLVDIIELTSSEFGFIGDVLQDEEGHDYVKCYAFSNIAWNDETRRFYEEHKSTGFVFRDLNNLFGHVITDRKPVIANDPENDSRSKGIPSGHPRLTAFLGVPVYYGERLVGLIGLANRPGGYDEELLSYIQPVVDACGQIIVARWERDARIEAQQGLSDTRKYLQDIIDSMPSVLVAVDSNGDVTQWNQGAESFSGIDAKMALGRSLEELLSFSPDQLLGIMGAVRAHRLESFKQISRREESEQHYYDVIVYPLSGPAEESVVRIDDVTERMRMELMMVQSEKMMSVGGLAAGMAHELNNPLGGILQGLQNIRRRLSMDLEKNEEVAGELGFDLRLAQSYMEKRGISGFMDGVIDSSKRAADIVSNMLVFSRKPSGEFHPEQINQLIDQAVDLAAMDYDLKKKHDFRDIDIVRDYDMELPLVPCIGPEIQQVLLNLLRNSAQVLSAKRGQSRTITLRTYTEDGSACIEVKDDGPGMDQETCKRVFEPFFTTKPPGQGTGLGLSVSYFIVTQEHGGEMSVESAPGEGARFIIRLPLKAEGRSVS
ncbi:MAG: ATP-binding protein [Sedimenticola sp.]